MQTIYLTCVQSRAFLPQSLIAGTVTVVLTSLSIENDVGEFRFATPSQSEQINLSAVLPIYLRSDQAGNADQYETADMAT